MFSQSFLILVATFDTILKSPLVEWIILVISGFGVDALVYSCLFISIRLINHIAWWLYVLQLLLFYDIFAYIYVLLIAYVQAIFMYFWDVIIKCISSFPVHPFKFLKNWMTHLLRKNSWQCSQSCSSSFWKRNYPYFAKNNLYFPLISPYVVRLHTYAQPTFSIVHTIVVENQGGHPTRPFLTVWSL